MVHLLGRLFREDSGICLIAKAHWYTPGTETDLIADEDAYGIYS